MYVIILTFLSLVAHSPFDEFVRIIGIWIISSFYLVPIRCNIRVWRYQRGNQKPYIEEGQTTQWLKKKYKRENNDLQSTTQKTKDRVKGTPLQTRGELRCSEKVSNSCSTSGARRVTLVTSYYAQEKEIRIKSSFFEKIK